MRVIYMGKDKPAVVEGLKYLLSKGIEVVAVVAPTQEAAPQETRLIDVACKLGIPVVTDDELYDRLKNKTKALDSSYSLKNIDLVISFLFWKRLKKPLIDLPKIGCINFHPAPLPDFRGVGGYNFAIFEQLSSWGVAAHFVMDETFDTGEIIKIKRFDINSDIETAYSLEQKSLGVMLDLFKEVIDLAYSKRSLPSCPQGDGRYISKQDFENLRKIYPSDDIEAIERKIRAFWFPPYDGASIEIKGKEFTVINERISEQIREDNLLKPFKISEKYIPAKHIEKIVLIGGGGHCNVIIDAIHKSGEFQIGAIFDPKFKYGEEKNNVDMIGSDEKLVSLYKNNLRIAFISVGSIGDCSTRIRIYEYIKKIGFNLATVIHPSSVIASDCKIGEGTFIAAGVKINPGVRIGKNAIINTSSSVDHDCEIGDFVHIAPGAVLCGGVKIGDYSHIGAGAVINQYLKIGKHCLIGSGSVVTHDIQDNIVGYGVPFVAVKNNG
ncbi:MAG: NeuD/PglB/VioB family sugar acetyltransferase [Candidatus Omnitrophica bacterium]|nr:NeuD/PglB/VioB family sugar acetyltransferase [Candidatus Omnitrophota bacterium]MDD5352422.1 NeuD/PglB/VioB family sugar acetyltransferase [Candidatus Omnitrophota bacterium]MDD5550020.1 NeuD/PglB/VioB family sugar acetyltransferase [Candidatus Omnitrophota bacterium]